MRPRVREVLSSDVSFLKMTALARPILFLHGTAARVVGIEQSKSLFAACRFYRQAPSRQPFSQALVSGKPNSVQVTRMMLSPHFGGSPGVQPSQWRV